MTLKELRDRAHKLEKEMAEIQRLPVLEGYWIDSSTDGGSEVVRYRLCWFTDGHYADGKLKKKRRMIEPLELERTRAQVERGVRLKALRGELERVRGEIAIVEDKIRELLG